MLIWLEDAPVFGRDDDHDVTSFIDKIITCKKPNNDPTLELLVKRQIHRHCQTCRKNSKAECRFNFPQPPIRVRQYNGQKYLSSTTETKLVPSKHQLGQLQPQAIQQAKETLNVNYKKLKFSATKCLPLKS